MNTKSVIFLTVALFSVAASNLFGQASWNGGDGNWTDANWTGGSGPGGIPGTGQNVTLPAATGNVTVSTDLEDDAGAFGEFRQQGGALIIEPSGRVDFGGEARIGDGATAQGLLSVSGQLSVGGNLAVGFGTGAGSTTAQGVLSIDGSAVVRVGGDLDTWWDPGAQLIITGSDADIEVAGTLYLGTAATMIANLNADTFSTVFVPGTLNFAGGNGTLEVNFVDGYSPKVGNSWVLFDAATRGGTIPIVDLPDVGIGGLLNVNYAEGGDYGQLVTLDYINTLNLKVDTASGNVTIENPVAGGADLEIDGYIIRSASGSLLPEPLTGLGAGWLPGLDPSQSEALLSETNFSAATTVGQGQSFAIGSVFNPAGSQDLQFEFHLAGGGTLPGTIQYVGVGLRGDYNGNGQLDAEDLDWQAEVSISLRPFESKYDENNDGLVNELDREIWLDDLKKTWIGDANLDFEFNTADFVQVFTEGKYETGERAGWAQGDWSGDLIFDTADFVGAFTANGYERGPFPGGGAVAAVPEPASLLPLLVGLLAVWRRRR